MNQSFQVQLPTLDGRFPFRARRIQMGLSLEELSLHSGIAVGTLRRLELRGQASVETLKRLAGYLDLEFPQALALLVAQEAQMGRSGALSELWRQKGEG